MHIPIFFIAKHMYFTKNWSQTETGVINLHAFELLW